MSKAHAVILNPMSNAGQGAARWNRLLATDAAKMAGLGEAALFDGSAAQGGLEGLPKWLESQLAKGARNFVAAGGDGTVNLAVNALVTARRKAGLGSADVRFGAVGLGSSNDFQKPYDEKGREAPAGLHARLRFDDACLHDLGGVTLEGGSERLFIINASVGVTAEANWNFNNACGFLEFFKRNWVGAAIIITALKTFVLYRNFSARVSVEGGSARTVSLTNLGVVKNVHFSGEMRYDIPQALDDGCFGVHLCEGMSRLEMVKILGALNAGRFSGLPKTSSAQAATLKVEADEPFAVETDGEVARARGASFRVLKQEILVCP